MISLIQSIKYFFSFTCVSYLTFENSCEFCVIRAGMATKKLMKLQLNLILNKLSISVLPTWFTQELDYKAKFTTLTVLKISSNSWVLKSWHICWTHLIWNEKSIIFISNRSNLASYHGRHYVNLFYLLHWYDPYDCLWGPHWKLPWQVWLPHQILLLLW